MTTPPVPADPPATRPVRAVARVGVGASDAGPRRLHRHRPRHRVGGLRIEQLLAVEIVLIGALVLFRRPIWQVGAGALVGVVLLLAVFGTHRGVSWYTRLGLRSRYQRRRTAPESPRADDARFAVLDRLAPGLSVTDVEERDTLIGIGEDAAGWFSVAEVCRPAGMTDGAAPPLSLRTLAALLAEPGFPASSVQLVVETVPAPTSSVADDAPCQQSYRELLAAVPVAPVTHQTHWLTVRIDAAQAAELAAERGGGRTGVHRAIAASLWRVTKAVTGRGRSCRILAADELLTTLARSAGLVGSPDGVRIVEDWQQWAIAGQAHASLWVRDWPPLPEGPAHLLGDLVTRCGVRTSLSLVFRRPAPEHADESTVDIQALVRVSAEPDALAAGRARVRELAAAAGLTLAELDGEQGPGVYATAPTGVPR